VFFVEEFQIKFYDLPYSFKRLIKVKDYKRKTVFVGSQNKFDLESNFVFPERFSRIREPFYISNNLLNVS